MTGRIEHVLLASAEMAELRLVAPRLSRLSRVELIHASSDAASFSAYSGDNRVLVKCFRGENAVEAAKAASHATIELNRRLVDGRNRVPKFVELLPKRAILISEFISGRRLDELIGETDEADLPEIADRAAQWLMSVGATKTGSREFDGAYWLRFAEERVEATSGTFAHDLAIGLLERIATLRETIQGAIIPVFQGHGDFAPHNLILRGDDLYAVDIQSLRLIPPARDIARFLVDLSLAREVRAFPTRHGIAVKLLDPFLAYTDLRGGTEGEALFAFYIALDLLERLERNPGLEAEDGLLEMTARRFLGTPAT